MDKTVIVAVEWRQRHRLYRKSVKRITRFFAHDGENRCQLGDIVRIEETRPISRMKRWRVTHIMERHEVAEVQPIELDQPVLEAVSETETIAGADVDDENTLLSLEGLEDLDEDEAMLFAELEREQREAASEEEDEAEERQQ